MTINAAYYIRADSWPAAQWAFCAVQQRLYKGPPGEWVTEKQGDGSCITAINCDDKNKITPRDFAIIRDILTERIKHPEREEVYRLANSLAPLMVIDVV